MTTDRAAQLTAIAQEIHDCTACNLYKNTQNAVPGYGDVNAEILFIGEAPGAEEDKQGLPFVGTFRQISGLPAQLNRYETRTGLHHQCSQAPSAG